MGDKPQENYEYKKGSMGIGGILVSMWDMETEKEIFNEERENRYQYLHSCCDWAEGLWDFLKNFPFLHQRKPGIQLVAVWLPSPPPLDHLFGEKFWIHFEGAGDTRSEAVTADGIFSRFEQVRQ